MITSNLFFTTQIASEPRLRQRAEGSAYQFNHKTSKKLQQKIKTLVTALGLISCSFLALRLFSQPVSAERLESDSYVIQFGNFNITSGKKTSASYAVTDTVGQTGAGQYGAYGSSAYFVGGGFQYIYQIGTFGFTISDLNIPLGQLTPGVHSTRTNTLTISTRGAGGFTVYAYAVSPLRTLDDQAEIPNTTCDDGSCTISNASPWILPTIAGFGFNADGDTAATDFIDATYFRPFANQEDLEPMQVVMTSPNIAKDESVTITYKAGITGSQSAGNYQTDIIYVAVPGY